MPATHYCRHIQEFSLLREVGCIITLARPLSKKILCPCATPLIPPLPPPPTILPVPFCLARELGVGGWRGAAVYQSVGLVGSKQPPLVSSRLRMPRGGPFVKGPVITRLATAPLLASRSDTHIYVSCARLPEQKRRRRHYAKNKMTTPTLRHARPRVPGAQSPPFPNHAPIPP